jgi:hypothetical protein
MELAPAELRSLLPSQSCKDEVVGFPAFPRSAMLTDAGALKRRLQTKIPNYIAIVQAQQFQRKGAITSPKEKLEIAASNYLEEHVLARIFEDADLEEVWAQMGLLAQRALAALAALDDRAVQTGNKQLVADHFAANWPTPGEAPMFVWNASIGLGAPGDLGKDHDPSDGINAVALNSAYQVTNTELTIVCQPRSPSLHYPDQF